MPNGRPNLGVRVLSYAAENWLSVFRYGNDSIGVVVITILHTRGMKWTSHDKHQMKGQIL
jgi:hypothetical protein